MQGVKPDGAPVGNGEAEYIRSIGDRFMGMMLVTEDAGAIGPIGNIASDHGTRSQCNAQKYA